MTDFSKVLIRASAMGLIMTEPKSKADKEAGNLGQTAKSYLKKVYNEYRWGRTSDIRNKYTSKGLMVEPESITLVSRLDKKFYIKNEENLRNDYFSGTPDIFSGISIREAEVLRDIKSSWDSDTFLSNVGEALEPIYWWQGQIYMDLANCSEYAVDYCLVDTPFEIIESEKKKLWHQMNCVTEESPEYLAACAELESNMIFTDIPIEERRWTIAFNKDKEAIERAKEKVIKSREWLVVFEEMHLKGK